MHLSCPRSIRALSLTFLLIACSTNERGEDASIDGSVMSGPHDECGNGTDDDGDMLVDEGCPCAVGEEQVCFNGPVAGRNMGLCGDGVQRCDAEVEFGYWGACEFDTGPAVEVCEGTDDEDCDGAIDESCPCEDGTTRSCGGDAHVGACSGGQQRCAGGTWTACEGAVAPVAEICGDGIDNDCDGLESEGCGCVPEPEVCGDGVDNDCDGVEDEGCECSPSTELCGDGVDDDCDDIVDEGCECVPTDEVCGNAIDDDCDGAFDEGCAPTCEAIEDDSFRTQLEHDWPLDAITMDHEGRITVVRGFNVSPVVSHFSPDGRLLWEVTLDAPPSYPRAGELPAQKHDLDVDLDGNIYLSSFTVPNAIGGTSTNEGTQVWKLSRASGEVAWDRWLEGLFSPSLEVSDSLCIIASPVLGIHLFAFDLDSGAPVWEEHHPHEGGFAATLELASDGDQLYAAARVASRPGHPVDFGGDAFSTPSGFPEFAVAAYELATGSFRWVWHGGTTERATGLQALSVGGGNVDIAVGIAGEMTFAGEPVRGMRAGAPLSRMHVLRFDVNGTPRAVTRLTGEDGSRLNVSGMATRSDGGVYLSGVLAPSFLEPIIADFGGPVATFPSPALRAHGFVELNSDLSFARQLIYPGHAEDNTGSAPSYAGLAHNPCADAVAHYGAGSPLRRSGSLDFGDGYESVRGSFLERLTR